MSKNIIGLNDKFIIEIGKIRELMEQNENKAWMDKIDQNPQANKVIFDFKETPIGFIKTQFTILDNKGKSIENSSMNFTERDMLYLINKVEGVEYKKGESNIVRDINSTVNVGGFNLKDGDVYQLSIDDFLLSLKNYAHEENYTRAEVMKEYGIKNIFISMHYNDNRKMPRDKNFSINNIKDQQYFLNPYHSPSMEIFATDEHGTFFFEGDSYKQLEKQNSQDDRRNFISEDVWGMRLNHAIETGAKNLEDSKNYSNCYMVLEPNNIELLFNDEKIKNKLRFVENIHNDEYAFTSLADMHNIASKELGFKITAKAGDQYYLIVDDLNERVKEKYNINDNVKDVYVDILANKNDERYYDIKMSLTDGMGALISKRYLLKNELNELLVSTRNGIGVARTEAERVPHYEISPNAHILTTLDGENITMAKAYSVDIETILNLGNNALNIELNKLKELGNDNVLVSFKFDFPYIPNGHTDCLSQKFNKIVGFDASNFPEMNVYGFDNATGKAFEPESLKEINIEQIMANPDAVREHLLREADKERIPSRIVPVNYKTASIGTLETNSIFKIINSNSLALVEFNDYLFKDRSEFSVNIINQVGEKTLKSKVSPSRPKL